MRFFLSILCLAYSSIGFSAVYVGTRDLSADNLTTSYTLITTLTDIQKARTIACSNTASAAVIFYLRSNVVDCSDADAAGDWTIDASGNGNFALDNFPAGKYLCAKSASGTLSTGYVQCIAYWNEIN